MALHTPPLTALFHFKVRAASAQLRIVAQHSKGAKNFGVGAGRWPGICVLNNLCLMLLS